MRRSFALIVLLTGIAVVNGGPATTVNAIGPTGIPTQAEMDKTATASTYAGLWGDVTGGVAGRPFVTELSVTVTPADGTAPISRTFVTGGTVNTPASTTPGDITFVITPTNVCNKARGDVPTPGKCYADPNRLGATIGYVANQNSVGVDFSSPTNGSGAPLSTPLLDLIKNPANTTTFDLTLNMNRWGSKLRWTWLNGEPTYWNVNPIAQDNSLVRLKFNLATGPSEMCTSGIPVGPCNPAERGANFAPSRILKTDLVLSLDETGVTSIFAGSLFASSNADIGSLEAVPVGSPTLGLTYGVSGSNELSGEPNVARFFAFVADSTLINYFGVNQETLDAAEFVNSETLRVSRADGGTSETTGWKRWGSATNGTSGYFLSVTGVRFDGRAVTGGNVTSAALSPTQPAKWRLGNRVSNQANISRVGSRQRIVLSATGSACAKTSCRWVISKSMSETGTTMKKLTTVATAKGSARATATVAARKGDLVSVVLQAKSGRTWKFVTSRMLVGK